MTKPMRARMPIILFLCLALAACGSFREKFGRQQGHTLVTVQAPASCPGGNCSLTWPNIDGGMMVYIVGVNGSPFATTIPLNLNNGVTASANISVPNGNYMFYAVAWEGSSGSPLQGQAGCGATTEAKALTGGAQTVSLNVNQSTCNFVSGSIFSDTGSGYIASGSNFGTVNVSACQGVSGSSCVSPSATYNAGSVRVRMAGYVRNGPGDVAYVPSFGITGSCGSFSSATANLPERVPVGSAAASQNNFLAVAVDFYSGAGCTGTPTKTVHFPYGILAGISGVAYASNPVGSSYNLYVDVGP